MIRIAPSRLALGLVSVLVIPLVAEDVAQPIPNRPEVPGLMRLHLRERKETAPASKDFKIVERSEEWEVSKTAIIVIDMWDGHYCRSAAQRVGVIAPRMNRVITAARNHGVMIIHAPSGTVDMYADTLYRKRMQQALTKEPPAGWQFNKWCDLDPSREPPLPVDTSKCACDDPVVGAAVRQFSKQHPALDIIGYDGISDKAQEIYSFCEAQGISNIIIMGDFTIKPDVSGVSAADFQHAVEVAAIGEAAAAAVIPDILRQLRQLDVSCVPASSARHRLSLAAFPGFRTTR